MKIPLLSILIIYIGSFRLFGASATWTGTAELNSTFYGPGTNITLAGTFTNTFTITNSGTPANPITFTFASGANFTKPIWIANDGAITAVGKSNIVIDGGINGVIQCSSNGTFLSLSNNARGVFLTGARDVVVKNLTITNIYRKINYLTSGVIDETRYGYCIVVDGSSITVSNCTVSDGDAGITYSASATTQADVFLINNKLLDCNHTFNIGVAEPDTYLTNIVIAGNYMDHWDTWDAPGDTQIHLDGIIILNNSSLPSGVCRNFRIYNNYFGRYVGTRTTGAIFDSTYNFGIWDFYIFNNLFECQRSNSWGNGFISVSGSNVWVFNNTMIGVVTNAENWGGAISANGTNVYLYNNILASGSGIGLTASYFGPSNDLSSLSGSNRIVALNSYCGGLWSDYNILNGQETMNFQVSIWKTNVGFIWLSGILNTFQKWQTFISNTHGWPEPYWNQTHADPNSTTNLPSFNSGTYVPSIGDTVARGNGTNLTALLPNDPTMLSDRTGFPRSSSGNWTIGAFESLGQSASIAQGKFKRRGAR